MSKQPCAGENGGDTLRITTSTALLAASCAGLALPGESGGAVSDLGLGPLTAGPHTVTEPPDFSNDRISPTPLPVGTLVVEGTLDYQNVITPVDQRDYVEFSGLTPGEGFSLDYKVTNTSTSGGYFFDSSLYDLFLNGLDFESVVVNQGQMHSGTLMTTVPANGIVRAGLTLDEGLGTATYSLAIPEPGTAVLAAAAAIALLSRRLGNRRDRNSG